ncbi:hypothetical protein Asi03nite_15110 [Actinoplanes siamensis]|uniref:Uncharacterized protein n=1 Tax=Actinoplanes siamensis TaxID=1223317 RepID=A0A919N3Z4_9ACTN|nr:hypothetical protein Asi03nite_15110 [Actinoplanes siamensis]
MPVAYALNARHIAPGTRRPGRGSRCAASPGVRGLPIPRGVSVPGQRDLPDAGACASVRSLTSERQRPRAVEGYGTRSSLRQPREERPVGPTGRPQVRYLIEPCTKGDVGYLRPVRSEGES